jgi:energy-coupling factor transporter transmembrane protein EcfT
MASDISFYAPVRRPIVIYSLVVGLFMAINVILVAKYGGVFLWMSLAILVCLFIFLFMPVMKNPRLIIKGNEIHLASFGKWYPIDFKKNLREIVVKGDDVVSYRFDCADKFIQISPYSYYESDEICESACNNAPLLA